MSQVGSNHGRRRLWVEIPLTNPGEIYWDFLWIYFTHLPGKAEVRSMVNV